jgi:hypothetical protein
MAQCTNSEWTPVHCQNRTTAALVEVVSYKDCTGREEVGPTNRFTASPEASMVATVGTVETGYTHVLDTSHGKGQGVCPHTTMCPGAPKPASLLGRALVLPHVLKLQIPPPC